MALLSSELLATVSHELRSPLASIKGYTTTLLRHERRISREERHEFLMAIHEASDRLTAVINSLLEMSELESGTIKLEYTTVDINHLLREAIMVAETRSRGSKNGKDPFSQPHPTFIIHAGAFYKEQPNTLMIEADPDRLREVLDHLVQNAVLHASKGGTVDVTIQMLNASDDLKQFPLFSRETERNIAAVQQGDRPVVVIGVHDTGQGIPVEHLPYIFDPFYRIDTRLIRETNGLGLGLTICRRIIELHHGLLWAESENGKGSTFYLCLPQIEKREDKE